MPFLGGVLRGIVEFSATFLHSGFMVVGSFPDNTIPSNLSSVVNGTMYISTIGWTRRSAYFISILPFTVITILMFASPLYSILHARKRNSGYRTTFDPSNPLHLIMASAEAGKASTVVLRADVSEGSKAERERAEKGKDDTAEE
ncbi:uncharacterized protein F5891DRAFT_1199978 [Suillus fuscotomentosus]|uniref:Uncharacterized protein n=1 Tax=Suillus fuscotomentosus TaxID=1912939 RepID=A0AAD4DP63_9AGAM|nr:uncharacterized protein F5891DRAFT_1199978 [Suillus fuscotomentosus]KAG1887428.1 hypothetical protein F5891DRAFT_1199978 [Suillus fuscotomentosus]